MCECTTHLYDLMKILYAVTWEIVGETAQVT